MPHFQDLHDIVAMAIRDAVRSKDNLSHTTIFKLRYGPTGGGKVSELPHGSNVFDETLRNVRAVFGNVIEHRP